MAPCQGQCPAMEVGDGTPLEETTAANGRSIPFPFAATQHPTWRGWGMSSVMHMLGNIDLLFCSHRNSPRLSTNPKGYIRKVGRGDVRSIASMELDHAVACWRRESHSFSMACVLNPKPPNRFPWRESRKNDVTSKMDTERDSKGRREIDSSSMTTCLVSYLRALGKTLYKPSPT